ncbi:helix-turn-helix domain-containing protein [Kiloniella laminariae]|uniref:helix-turn-helix domain-containing protein n=1 Tax=Kiloniella laminariae TaxID=454162 RepID=UPI0012FA6F77|nr:short-chain fatty acyl-CoA regulator family protein [Kiloniella laminariae]
MNVVKDMARQIFAGRKIRHLRAQLGLTQVAMAGQLGISAAYLNLVEHNQRPLSRKLQKKLESVLPVKEGELSGGEEARMLSALEELFSDPLFDRNRPGGATLGDFVAVHPEICRAVLKLYRAFRNAREDRLKARESLSADPYFSDTSHKLLTQLTSIRSFAEILQDNDDLSDHQRGRFTDVLVDESKKLTLMVGELFDFINGESLESASLSETPTDEVVDMLSVNDHYFPELEEAAEQLRERIGNPQPYGLFDALVHYLDEQLGISVEIVPVTTQPSLKRGMWELEGEDGGVLRLMETLSVSSLVFRLARVVAEVAYADVLEKTLARGHVSSDEARQLCLKALGSYFAGALMMPYAAFRKAAFELRHDIDLLRRRFRVGFEQVCHRLTTLQKPQEEGVPFHFVRVDLAGQISKRFSASGLRIPRYGVLPAQWGVQDAFLKPGRISTHSMRAEDMAIYFSITRTVTKPGTMVGQAGNTFAVSLGCEISFARHMVYADGLDFTHPDSVLPPVKK